MTKKVYKYSDEKNKKLIKERNISFEEVIAALNNDQLLDVIAQPNQDKYPNQEIYIVQMNDYVYLIPFREIDAETVFLKTIFPSRKAKKIYLKNEVLHEDEDKK